MSVSYESTAFGDIRVAGIHGRAGLGLTELLISLDWTIQPKRAELLSIFGTSAWIYVQVAGSDQMHFLGHASPESAWCTETRDYANSTSLFYRLILPNPQMLALEELRHGRELVLTVDVRGNSYGPRGVRSFDQKVMHRVSISDWVRVLREANVADVLLVGVHMPHTSSGGPTKSAAELVRRANEHLMLGHYSAAVADCRLAIESLWKAAGLKDQATDSRKLLSNMAQQMSMTKRQRELAIGEALRIFCHTAHHVGANAEPEVFGRVDAALAVGVAAALVSSLASDPDVSALSTTKISAGAEKKVSAGAAVATEAADQTEKRIAHVLTHFKKQPANRPTTQTALRSLLESLFRKKLSSSDLDDLVSELKARGIVRINGKKLEYSALE